VTHDGLAQDGIAPVSGKTVIPPARAMEALLEPATTAPAALASPGQPEPASWGDQPVYTAEEEEENRQIEELKRRPVGNPFGDSQPTEPPVPASDAVDPFDIPDRPPMVGDAPSGKRHTWQDQSWLEYVGTIYIEYYKALFDDFVSGRMGLQLASMLKAIPRGVGQGATGTWDTFRNTYNGWKSILNDPAILAELDDATIDMAAALEKQVNHLDYLAQTNDPRFGEAIGELTGQAMFETLTGRASDIVTKRGLSAMSLTRKVASAPGDTAAVARAADASAPGPVLQGPTAPPPPARLTEPPGPPAPMPEHVQPVHNATARRYYPDPETRASTPYRSLGTPQQLDRSACAIATLRGILRDLGHFVPDEAWLVELAKSMGLFQPGMKAVHVQRLLDKLTELRMIPKMHVDVFSVLDLAKAFGSTVAHPTRLVAWLRRYFPDSPLLGGLITMSGTGHAVRLEGIAKGAASVGDPGMATGRSVVTSTRQLDRMINQVVVITPEGKPRPPSWIPRTLDTEPPGVPTGSLLKGDDAIALPLAHSGGRLTWPLSRAKTLVGAGLTGISAVVITVLILTFLSGGGNSRQAIPDPGAQEAPGAPGIDVPGGNTGAQQPQPVDSSPPGDALPSPGDSGSGQPPTDPQPAGPTGAAQDPPPPSTDTNPAPVTAPPPSTGADPPPSADPPPAASNDPPPVANPPPQPEPPPVVPDPPPPVVEPPPPPPPLQSGIYNGGFTPLVHNHSCCINPTGQGLVVYRFTGVESQMVYIQINNLIGPAAPDLEVYGGPFVPGEPFTITGSATFLGMFANVPVTFTGTLADRVLQGTVQVGGDGLPGQLPSTWTYYGTWAAELP